MVDFKHLLCIAVELDAPLLVWPGIDQKLLGMLVVEGMPLVLTRFPIFISIAKMSKNPICLVVYTMVSNVISPNKTTALISLKPRGFLVTGFEPRRLSVVDSEKKNLR